MISTGNVRTGGTNGSSCRVRLATLKGPLVSCAERVESDKQAIVFFRGADADPQPIFKPRVARVRADDHAGALQPGGDLQGGPRRAGGEGIPDRRGPLPPPAAPP